MSGLGQSPGPTQIDREELGPILRAAGVRSSLVLTTKSRRFLDEVVEDLGELRTTVFDGALTHVPAPVVTAAERVLADARPDAIIALGGGATIGLGKVLELRHTLPYVAIPTTYSGSEMTSIWGMTEASHKTTGRDERVRPDWVVYDGSFSASMPLDLTVQSLMNAMAHPISALSTGTLAEGLVPEAHGALRALVEVTEALLVEPARPELRRHAHEAAALAARILDRGTMGLHHKAAHYLGGRFNLPHGALHSVLLPSFVVSLRREAPEVMKEIDRVLGHHELEHRLVGFLERGSAAESLKALGLREAALDEALEKEDVPFARLMKDAFFGMGSSTGSG